MSEYAQGEPLYGTGEPDPDVVARMQAEHLVHVSADRDDLMEPRDGDVIWAMSPDGRITHVSREVERWRGFTPAEAAAQTLDEILVPESQAVSLAYFQSLIEVLQRGETPKAFRGPMEYTRKDGGTQWFDVQALPHVSDAGELIVLYGVSRPIDG